MSSPSDLNDDGFDPYTPLSNSSTPQCNIYAKYRKTSGKFFDSDINGYEGIPQNLVLNIIGWIVSLSVFGLKKYNIFF